MSYDTINGVKNRVDANNITHKITSDIEGKIITISHTNNNGTLTEGFEYYSDNKLNKITDSTGSTSFNYDNYGHLNQKTQTINGKDFKVYYEINNLGQLKSMTYPSGMIVHYDYNKGFLSNIYVNGTDIVKNVTYNSLEKEATSWILGSNTVTITKNTDGDVTNFVDNGVLNETLTVDGMSQISSVKDSINANNNISANYNYNYSISNWTNNVGNQSHGTTTNFNISSISGNGSSYSWNYITGTNKTSNYSYDNNGNVITDNKGNYVYDLKNNMISATRNNVTGNYYYNALNQRVIKSVNGQIRYFVYNESNQLIGEYDSTGNVITEYIYFGLRPVAIKTNGNIYMVHTDYLGTPRYILDNASNMLWKWERRDPYGNNVAQGTIEFNLRFAGQYYDVESGLNYNINRMYDANTKRYMQSDPMGLIAGWNTYNYVGRNPLNFVDPLGLDVDLFLGSSGLGDSKNTASPGHLGLGVTGFDGKIWHNLPGAGLVKGDFLESENFSKSIGIEGFMNLLPEDTLFYIRIKTTKEQDEKIIEYLNKEWKKSKEYVPIFNDCVTFVKNALSYAGIRYSHNLFDYSKTPYGVFNDIKNNNEVLESGQVSAKSLGSKIYNKNLLDSMLRGKL